MIVVPYVEETVFTELGSQKISSRFDLCILELDFSSGLAPSVEHPIDTSQRPYHYDERVFKRQAWQSGLLTQCLCSRSGLENADVEVI